MEFEIGINDATFYAYHGVEVFEREVGTEFKVSLSVKVPYIAEMEGDDLSFTVSYADLYQIVDEEMQKPRKLLETVALSIIRRIREKFSDVRSGFVTIEKVRPPIAGMLGRAFVTLNF